MFKPVIIKIVALFLFILGLFLLPILIGIPIMYTASDIKDYATELEKKILKP